MNTKNQKTIAFVPFCHKIIAYKVPFRFEKKWWERRSGSLNYAALIKTEPGWIVREMHESDIVGINKNHLLKRDYEKIIKEIKT